MSLQRILLETSTVLLLLVVSGFITGEGWYMVLILSLTGAFRYWTLVEKNSLNPGNIPFWLMVFCTMLMGRAYSITGLKSGGLPLYITEFMIGVTFLLILWKKGRTFLKDFERVPKDIIVVFLIYSLLGIVYLLLGYVNNGSIAFRDIVFGQYIFIGALTFLLVDKVEGLREILLSFVPVSAGLFFVGVSKAWNSMGQDGSVFMNLVKDTKMFNLSLYAGFFLIFSIAFYKFLQKKNRRSLVFAGYVALLLLLLIQVRTSWLAMIPALIIMTLFVKKEMFVMAILIPAVLITVVGIDACMGKYTVENIKEEVTGVVPGNSKSVPSANARWRIILWKQIGKQILDKPFLGWGFGAQPKFMMWEKYEAPEITTPGHGSEIVPPHNHILAMLFKYGFIGLGLFVYINLRVFLLGIMYLKNCKNMFLKRSLYGLIGALIYWHGVAMLFDAMESPPTAIFLWIILGLIVVVVRLDKEQVGVEL